MLVILSSTILEKNASNTDNWKDNYHKKKALLEQLKQIGNEEGISIIEQIKTDWNNIGKVQEVK